jgi:hypothetical protein
MIETDRSGTRYEVNNLDADTLLMYAADGNLQQRIADRRILNLVARWCALHPAKTTTGHPDVLDCDEALGGDGAPLVAAFTAEPLATALGISTTAALQLIADVLNLEHRHPMVWAKVQSLQVPGWRARRLAKAAASLSYEAARWVDENVMDRIGSCGMVTLDKLVAEAAARFDPEELAAKENEARAAWDVRLSHGAVGDWVGSSGIDAVGDTVDLTKFHDLVCRTAEELGRDGDTDTFEQRKAKALGVIADRLTGGTGQAGRAGKGGTTKFFIHFGPDDLGDPNGVGVMEGLGAATIARIRDWLSGTKVSIQPVLDMGRTDAVDRYEPPPWMAELIRLRDHHCIFPWCERDARSCDLDHIIPFVPGIRGQTRPENLAALCRRHHRCKTAGRWRYQRERDGTYTWTTPHGRRYKVTPLGTHEIH